MGKYCLQCGNEIVSKSATKFCCQSCAASYNNAHRQVVKGKTKLFVCNDCGAEVEGSIRRSQSTFICKDCAKRRKYERDKQYVRYIQPVESENHRKTQKISPQMILPSKFQVPLNSKQKGNLTELLCISAFYSLGYNVCTPFGENSRYDFIADIDGKLIRVQVKTSRLVGDGAYQFNCVSTSRYNKKKVKIQQYTKDEIDYFCTVVNDVFCLVPVDECSNVKTLRIKQPANNWQTHINWVDDYELGKMIQKIKDQEKE